MSPLWSLKASGLGAWTTTKLAPKSVRIYIPHIKNLHVLEVWESFCQLHNNFWAKTTFHSNNEPDLKSHKGPGRLNELGSWIT